MSSARQGGMLRVVLAWAPVCLYTLLIWLLSSQALHFPGMEGVPLRDKGVHFVEYGVLGFLMAHAVHVSWPHQRTRFVAALWLTVALGLVDEFHQVYVPGRTGDGVDLLADALGALLATLVYVAVLSLRSRRALPSDVETSRP